MIELRNVNAPLDSALGGGRKKLVGIVARKLRVAPADVGRIRILKRSVDARKKQNVHFVMTLGVELPGAKEAALVARLNDKNILIHDPAPLLQLPKLSNTPQPRPIVVGAGPAGLFCALALARAGAKPLLLERGGPADERVAKVRAFHEGGPLDTATNVQFGEGGAGTFSDGKLTTNTHDPRGRTVLEWFVKAGAPEEILWQAKPHIGTDKLVATVKGLRAQIISAGGEVRFNTRLDKLLRDADGAVRAVRIQLPDGECDELACSAVVLAAGHSARDTFEMLRDAGVPLECKPFAIGARIEHPQELINRAQWGAAADHPALGAADYKLSHHLPDGRGVFTFCMCPGGEVVAAASEEGGVVTNGMSVFARDGRNANSGLLVNVNVDDLDPTDPLSGVRFQQKWERLAFDAGEKAYKAPAQLVGDLLEGRASTGAGKVQPSYSRGVVWTDLRCCLPDFVTRSMVEALPVFDRKLHGFAMHDAVLTGVETRSSSPVRIPRGDNLQSIGCPGLYPCGEGAGYAGGIMSAAVDGLRVAEALLASLA